MAIRIKTLQVRVKDRHAALLRQMAFEVNQVFNHINEMVAEEYSNVSEYGPKKRVWLKAFDVNTKLNGLCKARGYLIQQQTCNEISKWHAKARKESKRSKLRWRVSGGPRRNLGWVPFCNQQVQWKNGGIQFAGHNFKVWDSYGLSDYKFRAGNFAEDARGRWYFNVAVEYECEPTKGAAAVGIDLGLKDIATTSDGDKLKAGLGIREWTCVECGVLHDRDINAARNILAAGHSRLAGGILFS